MTPLDDALRPAAARMLAALDRLPADVAALVVDDLAGSYSTTLRAIAAGFAAEGDRVAVLARSLQFLCLTGDIEDTADRLATSAPWGEIRSALVDAVSVWRAARPNLTTRRDRDRSRSTLGAAITTAQGTSS